MTTPQKGRFDFVSTKLVVQAMRDNGYKNSAYAISELIGNSIQAGAKSVELLFVEQEKQSGQRRVKGISQVAVLDNGIGMDSDNLKMALQIGNGTLINDRSGMGRFGMGLPSASISQCRRLEVWSWQTGIENAWYTYLDIDEIEDGKLTEVPVPLAKSVPGDWRSLGQSFGTSGTLVVWSNLDRCTWRTANAFVHNSEPLIGRMYRKFIDRGDVNIRVATFLSGITNPQQNNLAMANDELKDDSNMVFETLNVRDTRHIETVVEEERKMAEDMEQFIKAINVDEILQDDPTPLYDRIIRLLLAIGYDFYQKEGDNPANNLRNRIRLPSEETIAKVLRVSRVTSRRAFEDLRSVDLVDRSHRGSYLTMDDELFRTLGLAPIHGYTEKITNVDATDTERISSLFFKVSQIWPDFFRGRRDQIIANPPFPLYGGENAQSPNIHSLFPNILESDSFDMLGRDRNSSKYINSGDISHELPVMDEAQGRVDLVDLSRELYINVVEKLNAIQKENAILRKEVERVHYRLLNLET